MIAAATINPTLSPGFDRARKLSRVMAVIFTIGFWLTLLGTVLILGTPLEPIIDRVGAHGVNVGLNGITVSLDGLSVMQCTWVMLALEMTALPLVFLMHHARRVFGHFARGEIFVLPVTLHIRQAGIWLIVFFFANIAGQVALKATGLMPPGQAQGTTWPLVIGTVTFIVAYVMEEATRIATDYAEIV